MGDQITLKLGVATPNTHSEETASVAYPAFAPIGKMRQPPIGPPEEDICELGHGLVQGTDDTGGAQCARPPRRHSKRLCRSVTAVLATRMSEDRMVGARCLGRASFHMKSSDAEAIEVAHRRRSPRTTCAYRPSACSDG